MRLYLIIIILISVSFAQSVYAKDENFNPKNGDKCGTFLSVKVKQQIIESLCDGLDSNGRCVLQKAFPSPSGRFLIHYDTIGKNAVSLEDKDMNGVPDYVDSAAYYFDYAYSIEIDSLGYLAPFGDNGHGGSDAYDIYILNIGDYKVSPSTMYGLTQNDFNLNFPGRKFACFTSYIFIDNDYSPYDSTAIDGGPTFTETGINALKITAAHEFHHMIQYTYGVPEPSTSSLNEMTSVWMENRLFPESKDYIAYLKELFADPVKYPFGWGGYLIGYEYAIFAKYSYIKYGDIIIKRLWELIGKDIPGYRALDSAYREKGSNLVNEWLDFIPWLYYTGNRTKPGMYFPSASEYPEITFFSTKYFSPPSIIDNGYLSAFEFRAFRYILPSVGSKSEDTLDIILTNPDLYSAIIQDNNADKPYLIVCSNSDFNGAKPIGSKPYYYSMTASAGFIIDSLFLSSGTVELMSGTMFPNPFKTSLYNKLYFPCPLNSLVGDKAQLNIYNSDMEDAYYTELPITVYNLHKVAILESLPSNLSSGVYIFSVSYNGSKEFGKFIIIRE